MRWGFIIDGSYLLGQPEKTRGGTSQRAGAEASG
jgi:hypothetical protein